MERNLKQLLEKPEVQTWRKRAQSNPLLALASTLFGVGVIAGIGGFSTFAGALFGAGDLTGFFLPSHFRNSRPRLLNYVH
jgi:hypothetical protein